MDVWGDGAGRVLVLSNLNQLFERPAHGIPPWPSRPVVPGAVYPNRIAGRSASELDIACQSGVVLRSTDGARTWSHAGTDADSRAWAVWRGDDGLVVTVGGRGEVLRCDPRG